MKHFTSFLITLLLCASCTQKDTYEKALHDYVEEDLRLEQARIDYFLEELKRRAVFSPIKFQDRYPF